jgi:hypothetical protein
MFSCAHAKSPILPLLSDEDRNQLVSLVAPIKADEIKLLLEWKSEAFENTPKANYMILIVTTDKIYGAHFWNGRCYVCHQALAKNGRGLIEMLQKIIPSYREFSKYHVTDCPKIYLHNCKYGKIISSATFNWPYWMTDQNSCEPQSVFCADPDSLRCYNGFISLFRISFPLLKRVRAHETTNLVSHEIDLEAFVSRNMLEDAKKGPGKGKTNDLEVKISIDNL